MANKSPRKIVAEVGHGSRLSDLAYVRILTGLYERRLSAGSFVSQSELVELIGVPVAPLRDALRVLEAEGIVTIHPRTGIQFVRPGPELTRSTFQFRSIIETAAVAVYADMATDAEINELAGRHSEAEAAVEHDGLTPRILEELEALEQLLHGSIVASLQNPLVDSSYKRIRNYLRLLRLDQRMAASLVLRSLGEHAAIIEACRKRNATEAVVAIKAHFNGALQRTLGLY